MSFISILKGIGHGFETVTNVAIASEPLISVIPVIGPEAIAVINVMAAVENLLPGSKQGSLKKSIATQILSTNNPSIDSNQLSSSIDEISSLVNQLNAALAKLSPPAPAVKP